MTQKIPPIRESTLHAMVAPWLSAIHRKDLLAVMSYPASDRQRRLGNLLNEPEIIAAGLPKSSSYLWVTIDFREGILQTISQIEAYILSSARPEAHLKDSAHAPFIGSLQAFHKQTGKTIVLAAMGCEKLLKDRRTDILTWCNLQGRIGQLRQILFFEANLLDPDHVKFFSGIPTFLPRISIMHLYEREDMMQFMRLKEHDWNLKLSKAVKESLYAHCGGVILFTKEAIRLIRDYPHLKLNDVWNHIEMQFNVSTLWHGFGDREQKIMISIAHGTTISDPDLSQSLHYLLLTGFVRQKGHGFELTVPLLTRFIVQKIPKNYRFSLDQDSVLLNGTAIDANFSKHERRLLTVLIRSNNEVVPRTELAESIWPEHNGDFSDWALDSMISRVRKKLSTLGLCPETLTVVKKQGVKLTYATT